MTVTYYNNMTGRDRSTLVVACAVHCVHLLHQYNTVLYNIRIKVRVDNANTPYTCVYVVCNYYIYT